jgi:hypothetical protein
MRQRAFQQFGQHGNYIDAHEAKINR